MSMMFEHDLRANAFRVCYARCAGRIQPREYDSFTTLAGGSKGVGPSSRGFTSRPIGEIMGNACCHQPRSPLSDRTGLRQEMLDVMHHVYLAITFIAVVALVFVSLVALARVLG